MTDICFYPGCTKEAEPRKKRWSFPLCAEHGAEATRLFEAITPGDPQSPAGIFRFWAKCERAHPEHGQMQLTKEEIAELMEPTLQKLEELKRKLSERKMAQGRKQ